MARGRNSKKIVPFTKTAPTEGIDKVPETAGLDDYDKMIAKLANSSDEIIDNALEKLEEKPVKEHKPEEPKKPETEDQQAIQHTEENENQTNPIEPKDEPIPLSEKIDELKKTIQTLKLENESLKNRISSTEPILGNASMFREEIAKLTDKNDDLILRNSELEFEISRLRSENNVLKGNLETALNKLRLPPQTNSREAYTRMPQNINRPRNVIVRQKRPVMSMNGYESWN